MPLIPDRFWEQMTEDERELATAYIDGFRHEPKIVCPHCGGGVAVRLKIVAGATLIDRESGKRVRGGPQNTPPRGKEPTPSAMLGARDRAFLEAARQSGLLAAFYAAVRTEKEHSGAPADVADLFLKFWKTAEPIKVNAPTLAVWIDEFGGRIEVLQADGIIAILSDGLLMSFFPNRLTQPAKSKDGKGSVSNEGGFGSWRKGKFGYVPVEARSFGEALKQRNIGTFGTLVQ